MRVPTVESFTNDVKNHKMTIMHDSAAPEVYRHIRFKQPETINMYFDLTTWPGHLCISGDMGCFVFSRLNDMFEFFRSDNGRINPQYWHEKVQAENKNGGVEKFEHETFKKVVMEEWNTLSENNCVKNNDLYNEIIEMLVHTEVESEQTCYERAMDLLGHDFCERSCREYTYHYIWCLHAIVWGIQQYDAHKDKIKIK